MHALDMHALDMSGAEGGDSLATWSLPVRTARLVLRPLIPEDLDEHLALCGDAAVVRFLYEDVMDRDAAMRNLARRLPAGPPTDGEWVNLAVMADDRFVGEVALRLVSRAHRQCEIGYVLTPLAQGQGYATEAAEALLRIAFTTLDAHRVVARADARNAAAIAVMERLGMSREALLRENEWIKGEWTDEVIYALRRDEWQARSRSTPGKAR